MNPFNEFDPSNAAFVQQMYEDFVRNPASVDEAWRNYFIQATSPGGTKIAFRSDRGGGDPDIYAMKAKPESKKNRPKNLTANDMFDSDPDWQPIP